MPMKIVDFGGLVPKAQPRELPDNAAQTATDLHPGTREFRPLAADTTVVADSGVTNPLTIWRFQRKADGSLNTDFADATAWKALAIPTSYAKVPLDDDKTDRHVATTDDGTFAARVFDATGDVRLLGVPPPGTAPTIAVNTTDEFSTDERASSIEEMRNTVVSIVRANATAVWRGATAPGTGTSGYADRSTANGFDPADARQQMRLYRLTAAGGTVSDAYSAVDDSAFSWIFDPQIGGIPVTTAGALIGTWAGASGQTHIAIPFTAYGISYDIDTATARTQLAALEKPGYDDGTKLFTSAQLDTIVSTLSDYVDTDGAVVAGKLGALSAAAATLKTLLDGGSRDSLAATREAFYSKADVAAEIAQMITNSADIIFNMADAVARSSVPNDYGNIGGA